MGKNILVIFNCIFVKSRFPNHIHVTLKNKYEKSCLANILKENIICIQNVKVKWIKLITGNVIYISQKQ